MPSIKKMRRRKMNVLRNLQSFSQGFLAILFFLKIIFLAKAAVPGYIDFDNLPETNFTCAGKVIGGYYADLETSCQMFHVCVIGQGDEPMDIKFLCLNGTVFDQETRVCERVDEVDCSKSERFYYLNLELYDSEDPTPTTTTTTTTTKPTTTTTTPVPTTTVRTTHAPKTPRFTSPPPTKTSTTTTRKNVPLVPTPPTLPRPSQKPDEYEYYEEDYLEEEQHSSSVRPSPVSFQQKNNYHTANNNNNNNNYRQPVSNNAPSPPRQQQLQHQQQHSQQPQVESSKINHPYTNPYFKRPTQLYTSGQNLGPTGYSNYGRQHVINSPVLAEVSQPKPFEGYRRQPQPSVPLTFPSFEVSRQPKSVYHLDEELDLERKDTKRSDPDYYAPLEPTASATDDDKHVAVTNATQIANNHNINNDDNESDTDDDDGGGNNDGDDDDDGDVNQSSSLSSSRSSSSSSRSSSNSNSYEKLLTPQNVYIANLPKVINTVSVSVSDQTGKKLNLSLANIFAEQNKNTAKLSYDDYKEDEISAALLEPFFLDVPKISPRNITVQHHGQH